MVSLNTEQLSAVSAVKAKKNIFLTGSPGTGKSFTLKEIIKYLSQNDVPHAVTSSTGCSAVLINGQTIHSYFSLGISDIDVDKIVQKIKQYRTKYNQIRDLKCLIIDEISMIDTILFEGVSNILKKIKGNNMPFGGIQMIFVGDFCQLSPVKGDYCFNSQEWKDCNLSNIVLKEFMRQKDDIDLQNILSEVRFGKCSNKTLNVLKKLKETKFGNKIVPTKLFSLTSHVNTVNQMNYEKTVPKNIKSIQCFPPTLEDEFSTTGIEDDFGVNCTMCYNAVSNDKKTQLNDYKTELYVGLQVMVTRNISIEKRLINGTMGIVSKLAPTYVQIVDKDENEHIIYYHKDTNENTKTYTKFMPIKLAYALSIHKSQGATLDAVEVDGGVFIFAPGQLYTALSRAQNLQSIKILDIDKSSFICHCAVKQFYEKIMEYE